MPAQLQAVPPVRPARQPIALAPISGQTLSREPVEAKRVSSYVPPEVLKRVPPLTTRDMNNVLTQMSKARTVDVHAMLDDKGKIIKLDLAQEARSISPVLTSVVVPSPLST
jgi:hypothetical protein